MARPRMGITLENMYPVESYFYGALKDNRLFDIEREDSWNLQNDANEAFKKLPPIDRTNDETREETTQKRRVALQEWVDQYVPPDKWQRCLMTLRQNKSRKKLQLKRVDLTLETYLLVKHLAEKMNLTIGETIYQVAKPVLDTLYAAEKNHP